MNESPPNILRLPLLLLQQLLSKGQLICTRSDVYWQILTGVSYLCLSCFSVTHFPNSIFTTILQTLIKTVLNMPLFVQPISRRSLFIGYNFLIITSTHSYLIVHTVTHVLPWPHRYIIFLYHFLHIHTPFFFHTFVHCISLYGMSCHPSQMSRHYRFLSNHQAYDEVWSHFRSTDI